VAAVFGIVVGVVAGAAVQSHAAAEGGDAEQFSSLPQSPPEEVPQFGVWDRLASCESGGDWHAATGNGYWGGLQEDLPFWRRHGGLHYAARPDLASRAAQIAVAEQGLSVQGWAAWPVCARRLGLR